MLLNSETHFKDDCFSTVTHIIRYYNEKPHSQRMANAVSTMDERDSIK